MQINLTWIDITQENRERQRLILLAVNWYTWMMSRKIHVKKNLEKKVSHVYSEYNVEQIIPISASAQYITTNLQ